MSKEMVILDNDVSGSHDNYQGLYISIVTSKTQFSLLFSIHNNPRAYASYFAKPYKHYSSLCPGFVKWFHFLMLSWFCF